MSFAYSKMSIQDQAVEDANKLEREMNQMFKELDDMQEMIKGNRDLK